MKNKMQVGVPCFPPWLQALLKEEFYIVCDAHQTAKIKNEKNVMCLDCCVSICYHCLPAHWHHCFIQMRRYMYHDVVKQDDLQKLVDCSYIQAFVSNGTKVMFLNQRPYTRRYGAGNVCNTCRRSIQEPNKYCCLACKLHHLVKEEGSIGKYLRRCDVLLPPKQSAGKAELDDGLITPDSVLDPPAASFSFDAGAGVGGQLLASCRLPFSTATIEFERKKRSVRDERPVRRPARRTVAVTGAGRRKGIPCRAPLY